MSDPDSHSDPRTAATGTIAGCGVGALAISLIFGKAVGGGILLPALVILGAALAVAAVWRYGDSKKPDAGNEISELRARVVDLEERLEAAETVEAFEDRLAEKEATMRLESSETTARKQPNRRMQPDL